MALLLALALVPEEQPPAVWAGRPQPVRVVMRNEADTECNAEVSTRLFQATAATVVPIGEPQPWKTLRVLPGQTVIESATLTFPLVRAPARFLVQWGAFGRTQVLVYPDNILQGLGKLAGEKPLGVFDPDNRLKPVFNQAKVRFVDFEVETEDCRLALVWAKKLPESVEARVKKGMGAVWVRPAKAPAAYAERSGEGIIVVAPPATVDGLADAPGAQLNLLRFAELALQWPETNQP